MTPCDELASSLFDLSRKLVAALKTEPEHGELRGNLATITFAADYWEPTLIIGMEEGQRLEVSLSIKDCQFLHEELSRMIETNKLKTEGDAAPR